jgi:hypothetical protein
MRAAYLATLIALQLAYPSAAYADDLGMRGLGDIVLLAQYYAGFFILQFVICFIVAARRMRLGKRLSGAVYFLVPIETAVVSSLVIYFIAAFFPAGFFGSLLILVLTPPIVWPLLHIVLHRSGATDA